MLYLACKNYGSRVSNFIELSEQKWSRNEYGALAEQDFVDVDKCFRDEDDNYILNISDKRNLFNHPDKRRFMGCCGPPAEGEPNLLCQCKQEVAREVSDCITPYYIKVLKGSAVEVKDKYQFFSLLQRAEAEKHLTPEEIQNLLSLLQYDQVKEAIAWFKESLPECSQELSMLPKND